MNRENKRILILEDRDEVAQIAGLLNNHGYSVIRARDIKEAIWYLEVEPCIIANFIPYHAILLDTTVPGCGGQYMVPGTKTQRTIDHHKGANGYAYYRDYFIGENAVERLKHYAEEGRCAFYTAYRQEIFVWASDDGFTLHNMPLYEKGTQNLAEKICNWLDELPQTGYAEFDE